MSRSLPVPGTRPYKTDPRTAGTGGSREPVPGTGKTH